MKIKISPNIYFNSKVISHAKDFIFTRVFMLTEIHRQLLILHHFSHRTFKFWKGSVTSLMAQSQQVGQ